MARYVTVSALGSPLYRPDPRRDLDLCVGDVIEYWDRELGQVLPEKPDLIVLPETCDTPSGFEPERALEYYAARGSRVCDHLSQVACAHGCNIVYPSLRRLADGTLRNGMQFINRLGGIDGAYSKNFPTLSEQARFKTLCGNGASVIQTDFGTVGGIICFDLNFDELRFQYMRSRPELLVFSSLYHGGLMQGYWAYSCRAYFIGAVSEHICEIRSPLGNVLASSTNYFHHVSATINLDFEIAHLDFNWEKLRMLKEKYGRGVSIYDPGHVGAVLITSETDAASAADMVREFEIETLGDYFARSIAMRHAPGMIES